MVRALPKIVPFRSHLYVSLILAKFVLNHISSHKSHNLALGGIPIAEVEAG